jgi:hypothetical protein
MAEEESGGAFETSLSMSFTDRGQQEQKPGLLRTPARRIELRKVGTTNNDMTYQPTPLL